MRSILVAKIIETAAEVSDQKVENLDEASRLIGEGALLKSRAMVELLLALEEYMEEEHGVVFDWSSDSAMSSKRSIFRSIGSLADNLNELVGNK